EDPHRRGMEAPFGSHQRPLRSGVPRHPAGAAGAPAASPAETTAPDLVRRILPLPGLPSGAAERAARAAHPDHEQRDLLLPGGPPVSPADQAPAAGAER